MSEIQWDQTVDMLIVGSGAASVCAALIAKDHGLEPLIVEKLDTVGGCTAYSGGGVWIPNNHLMARDGVPDSHERARQYLDAAIWYNGPATKPARREAFLRDGPAAIAYLERKGMKMRRARFWPDYHSDLPGAEQTSRTIVAELFDMNELGEWKQYFSFSKMAPLRLRMDELNTLLLVKRTWSAKWFALKFVARLLAAKMAGRDLRGGGVAWQGRLLQIALRENIPIWRSTPVEKLITEGDRVVGVQARRDGKPFNIRARRGVLLNAGGYARNAELRERYGPHPVYAKCTNVPPGDTGDMIQAAMALGAAVDCMDEAIWGVTSLGPGEAWPEGAVAPDGTPIPFGHHFDISLPHVILVDQDGRRFCDEAGSYMELGQRLYRRHAETGRGIPAWAIIESRHRERYMLWGSVFGKAPKSWFDSGYMKRANTIEELARQCGIDPMGLRAEIERYNSFCRKGVDEDFGRGSKAFNLCHGDPTVKPNASLGAIEKPPFYAVAIYPGDVGTYGGLVTDEHARVLKDDGSVIEGLYATGTSAASVFGRTYPGAGASIGPALAFGFTAAQHMVRSTVDRARTKEHEYERA
jgi:3-oxosteroid 1-dehydrogenase